MFLLIWIVVFWILYFVIKKLPNGYVLGVITAILVYAAGWLFVNRTPVGGDDNHVLCIGVGGGLGIVMLFNVWGIIWPNNKKIIRAAGRSPARRRSQAGPPGLPGVANEFLLVRPHAVLYGGGIALREHGDLREVGASSEPSAAGGQKVKSASGERPTARLAASLAGRRAILWRAGRDPARPADTQLLMANRYQLSAMLVIARYALAVLISAA